MNSNGYTKVPQHMRAEVKRVIEMHRGRRVPLRRQTLSALKRGHFHAEHGPLDLDFERQFKWMVDEEMYSQDFKKKLRTVIPKQKEIEKKVIQLVLKTYRNFERRYLQSTAKSNSNNAIANSNLNARWKNEFRFDSLEAFSRYNKLEALIDPGSDTLERYRDQLLAKEIIKALGIRTSELRPNMRNDGYSLATTKAYITHKNPLNRPDSNNQTLVTNNHGSLRPEHSIEFLIRLFLWPIYYKKIGSKLLYVRKIVPANVNPDYVTLNNFKNGDKVIGYGVDPKHHEYVSQNSFQALTKMTPTQAFLLRSKKRVPLFKHPTLRNKFVTQHDLRFVEINMKPRYNKAAVKIQSRRKKSPSKNNNSPPKRRTLRSNAATARATASKRRSP